MRKSWMVEIELGTNSRHYTMPQSLNLHITKWKTKRNFIECSPITRHLPQTLRILFAHYHTRGSQTIDFDDKIAQHRISTSTRSEHESRRDAPICTSVVLTKNTNTDTCLKVTLVEWRLIYDRSWFCPLLFFSFFFVCVSASVPLSQSEPYRELTSFTAASWFSFLHRKTGKIQERLFWPAEPNRCRVNQNVVDPEWQLVKRRFTNELMYLMTEMPRRLSDSEITVILHILEALANEQQWAPERFPKVVDGRPGSSRVWRLFQLPAILRAGNLRPVSAEP